MEKILILGATGAMGWYLTQKLVEDGYYVDAVSQDRLVSEKPNLRHIYTDDAREMRFVEDIAKNNYDAIVDFMTYNSLSFRHVVPIYLARTQHYIYLSSCRVFANEENPVRETSPRLIDVTTDPKLIFSDDYCMHKARGENALRAWAYKNWTIVRPSTTYSRKRCQLLTLERPKILECLRQSAPVLLYEGARNIPASLNWGGDVAEMIKRLLFNDKALCDDFNTTSSESLTWQEIADCYRDVFGLKVEWVDEIAYQRFRDPTFNPETSFTQIWQLRYARLFNRVYDNSKMLAATGLKQEDFLTFRQGLQHERASILEGDI